MGNAPCGPHAKTNASPPKIATSRPTKAHTSNNTTTTSSSLPSDLQPTAADKPSPPHAAETTTAADRPTETPSAETEYTDVEPPRTRRLSLSYVSDNSVPLSEALPAALEPKDVLRICQMTHCDRAQVEYLYECFKKISQVRHDDGIIDADELATATQKGGVESYVKRLFALFDTNDDACIDFEEFCVGVSKASSSLSDDRMGFAFRLCDLDGDNFISESDLIQLLQSSDAALDDETIKHLAKVTLVDCADARGMDREEYARVYERSPWLQPRLDAITIIQPSCTR